MEVGHHWRSSTGCRGASTSETPDKSRPRPRGADGGGSDRKSVAGASTKGVVDRSLPRPRGADSGGTEGDSADSGLTTVGGDEKKEAGESTGSWKSGGGGVTMGGGASSLSNGDATKKQRSGSV